MTQGKGGKGRVVPVGTASLQWVEACLERTRPQQIVDAGEQAFFLSNYGERMSATCAGNWVTKTVKAPDIGKRGSCHLFSHSCATHMLENGVLTRLIQQLLGHARLDTTQIYTKLAIKALREVHSRAHPSSNLEESRNTAMLHTMNAAQIIEEIQRLPEDERGKVLDFARHQPNAETLEAMCVPTDDLPRFETVEDLFKELLD